MKARRYNLFGGLFESDLMYLRHASRKDAHMRKVLKKMGLLFNPKGPEDRLWQEDKEKRLLKGCYYGRTEDDIKNGIKN